MSAWAKPGAKVVCINGKPIYGTYSILPKEGAIYTIKSVCWYKWAHYEGLGVFLEGVERSRPVPFTIDRFRPLITKTQEQDVSMFKSLLNKTPINETA